MSALRFHFVLQQCARLLPDDMLEELWDGVERAEAHIFPVADLLPSKKCWDAHTVAIGAYLGCGAVIEHCGREGLIEKSTYARLASSLNNVLKVLSRADIKPHTRPQPKYVECWREASKQARAVRRQKRSAWQRGVQWIRMENAFRKAA